MKTLPDGRHFVVFFDWRVVCKFLLFGGGYRRLKVYIVNVLGRVFKFDEGKWVEKLICIFDVLNTNWIIGGITRMSRLGM